MERITFCHADIVLRKQAVHNVRDAMYGWETESMEHTF